MPLTLTCPSCGQQCAVKEEYAGMQVRCPRCPGVITVPMPAPAVIEAEPISAEPVAAMPAGAMPVSSPPPVSATAPPPIPAVPAGPSFIDNITKLLAANGVTGVNQIVLLAGLGCLALFLITVLFPWFPALSADGRVTSQLGITNGMGIIQFLLVLGILFLIVFSVMLGWTRLFDYALWSASNLSIFCALHLVVFLQHGRWGMIMSFIVMLAAAATLSVVAFAKVFKSSARQ